MPLWNDSSGEPLENLLRSSYERHRQGDLEGAIEDYSAAIERTPHVTWLWVSRGLAQLHRGDPESAILDFDRALHLDPASYEAHEGRAWARFKLDDFKGALADHAWMVEQHPNPSEAYAWRSQVHGLLGDYDRAMDDCTFAIELDPKNAVGYAARAWLRWERKDAEGAMVDCNQSVSLNPSAPRGYSLRAQLHSQRNEMMPAIADYSKAIELEPRRGWAYYGRGVVHYCRSKWEDAIQDFEWASQASAFDAELRDYAQLRLWMTLTRAGRGGKASETWSRYLESRPRRRGRDWLGQLANYLMGLIGEVELYRHAEHANATIAAGQLCQAHFHVGINRFFRVDRKGAARSFEECLATGLGHYYEHRMARAELAAIKVS